MSRSHIGLEYLHLNEVSIPIFVHQESRSYVRASFASKGVNLRIPMFFSTDQIRDQISWCKEWARKKIIKKPALVHRYIHKSYGDGFVFSLFDGDKTVNLIPSSTTRKRMYIENGKICIQYDANNGFPSSELTRKNIIRLLNKEYQIVINQRLDFINDLTLKAAYSSCTLKYLKTQWGNCGLNGKIKLSTRVLLLPEKIQNAIILHEIVHLDHFSHGEDFYNTLLQFMPDYYKRMDWLRNNEPYLDF